MTQTQTKVKFVAHGQRWFDKVNGNTYHSVSIIRCADGARLACEWQYGYDNHYRQTALEAMQKAGWIPSDIQAYEYERLNDYPIQWTVSDGLKREMIANGK